MSLKIVQTPKKSRKEIEKEKWEKYWESPPPVTSKQLLHIEKAKQLIDDIAPLEWVCDLGSGTSPLASYLLEKNCQIDAVDISKNALSLIKEPINTFQEALPRTKRDDFFYDLVLALDVIAELHPQEYRLFLAEISRLMKRNGYCLISTPLDTSTNAPDQKFLALLQTEFTIHKLSYSHHLLTPRLEKVTEFLFPERGKTHLIALGTKKPLM